MVAPVHRGNCSWSSFRKSALIQPVASLQSSSLWLLEWKWMERGWNPPSHPYFVKEKLLTAGETTCRWFPLDSVIRKSPPVNSRVYFWKAFVTRGKDHSAWFECRWRLLNKLKSYLPLDIFSCFTLNLEQWVLTAKYVLTFPFGEATLFVYTTLTVTMLWLWLVKWLAGIGEFSFGASV